MKRSVKWAFLAAVVVLVGFAVAGFFLLRDAVPAPENPGGQGEPVGTPKNPPAVDQRPVPGDSGSGDALPGTGVSGAPAPDTPAQSASGSLSAAASDAPSSADSAGMQEERILHGVVVDAATSSITVRSSETGEELSFLRETADVTGRLVEDAQVDIYYIGTIQGTDTSGAYVTRIVVFS